MHYGLQQCPVESYPLSGTKNTFTCYRKWTDGGNVAPLLAEDVEHHYAAMGRYAEPELDGDEWTPAEFPAYEDVST